MNKKFMTFGIVAFFALALVSAGLVSYISNTTSTNINVESPIVIGSFEGDISPTYGGEIQTISTDLTNMANAQIKGKIEVLITNNNISINDFNSLDANIKEYVEGTLVFSSGDVSMLSVGGFIESIDTSVDNEITITTTERTFEIGETWDADIALGFKANANGNYNVAVTIVPLE